MNTRVFVLCLWLIGGGSALADPLLVSSTLPTARSVAIGATATYFATVINAGDMEAQNCFIEKFSQNLAQAKFFPGGFSYQTVDATNTVTGTPDTPVNIPAGGIQGFVFALTSNAAFAGVVQLRFRCDGGFEASSQPGINDVFLTAATPAKADPIAILATPSADGALRIGAAGGIEAAGGSVVNNEGTDTVLTVTPRFSFAPPTVNLSICETGAGGVCMAAPTPSVNMTVGAVGKTFTVLADANDAFGIGFLPQLTRLNVDFADASGAVLGGTSVALTAPKPILIPKPNFPAGYYRGQLRYNNDTFAGQIQNMYTLIDTDGAVYGVFEWTIDGLPNFRRASQAFVGNGTWTQTTQSQNFKSKDAPAKPENLDALNRILTGDFEIMKQASSDDMTISDVSLDTGTFTSAVIGDPSNSTRPGTVLNVLYEAMLALSQSQSNAKIDINNGTARPAALADASYTLIDPVLEGPLDPVTSERAVGFFGSITIAGTALTTQITYNGQQTCDLSGTIGAKINESNIYRLPSINVMTCATDRMIDAPGEYEGFLVLNEVNPAAPGDNARLILLKKDRAFGFALLGTRD